MKPIEILENAAYEISMDLAEHDPAIDKITSLIAAKAFADRITITGDELAGWYGELHGLLDTLDLEEILSLVNKIERRQQRTNGANGSCQTGCEMNAGAT